PVATVGLALARPDTFQADTFRPDFFRLEQFARRRRQPCSRNHSSQSHHPKCLAVGALRLLADRRSLQTLNSLPCLISKTAARALRSTPTLSVRCPMLVMV